MPKVTNISSGARGAYLKGQLVMAEPGQTIEADDFVEEWFAKGEKPLAELSKAQLEEIAEREGVDLSAARSNEDRVAAIEAKRAAA